MGGACTCVNSEGAIDKGKGETQNSKFFYYSDPNMLDDFQDRLKHI
jgi:hypothetical protein